MARDRQIPQADIDRIVAETRAAQGLPPRVEDPVVLAQVADMLLAGKPAGAEVSA